MLEVFVLAVSAHALVCVPARDGRGRIQRSGAAVAAFRRENSCPATGRARGACPGYVVDHVIALKRCGPDDASNMQWQSAEEARAKDRWE